MADRKEIINQLTSLMKEGKISDAYRAYEELPFVDQIIVAVSPGVGDALAGYEIKEFSSRAAKNVEDKDYLGATGNFAIASLAGISLIPLFRWLRGTKGAAKAATEIATPRKGKAGLKGPGEYQAEQAAKKEAAEKAAEETLIKAEKKLAAEKEAAKKAELPVVEEFIPLTGKQLEYPGTRVSKSTKEITGLTSKVAKFINNNNNFSGKNEFLKTQGKIGTYINALKKAPGITEGELRLLRLVDETGEIHPAVLNELAGRNPNTRITRQRLSQYIQTNQKEALQRRLVAKGEREAGDRLIQNNRDVPLSKEKEYSYHVKGIKRGDYLGRHYGSYPEHKPHYSFDAAADLNLAEVRAADGSVFPIRSNADIMGPTTPIIKRNDAVLNVGRIQSDYSKELGKEFDNNKLKQIELIVRKPSVVSLYDDLTISINRMRDEVSLDLIGSPSFLKQSCFIEAIAATARKTPDLKSSDQLQKAFIKEQEKLHKLVEEGKPLTKSDLIIVPSDLSAFAKIEGSSVKDSISKITKNIKEFNGLDIFEPFIKSTKEVKEISSISPYIDNKAIATLRKELSNYNKNVPIINKLSLDEVKLQDKIKKIQKETKLTADSPSIADDLAKLDSIQDMRTGLMSKSVLNNMDSFKGFTLSPKELTDATGKTFEESLDKSLDQIFYDFKTIDERTGAIQQTFTGTPLERATEYFNQTVNNNKMTYDIGKGIKLLKEATDINIDNFKGFPLDPYAKGTKTEMFKFPVRSRFLEAVTKGYDGFSLDSAAKRLGDEGGQGTDFLETFYDKDVPNEINKMLKELGVNPKEYVGKVSAADNFPYSGTYVKIDDALRKLVQEKGIDAFKAGGPVKDDLPDVGSITPIGPYTKPLKPDLTYGDPVINKLKKAFNFLGDVKEFVLPTPKVTDPLSLIDYVTSSSPPAIAGKTVVKGLSKIDLDGEDVDELVEWVASSKTQGAKDRIRNLLNGNFYSKRNVSKEKNPIKNTTQKYLKENNLVDKNGNVHLYRYLNIHESKTLQPDQGLSSLTLNPNHAKEMAYKQANVKGSQLKAGEKADIFDTMDPFAGSKYETTTMYRKPVVLEYMVPAEKIDAYLPAVFNSLDDASISKYSAFNADNRFSNLIDELVEDGDEYYDAVDSIGKQYGVDDFYDALDTVAEESEALVDLTNIKPKNIYTESLEIDQIANNPLIEKLEFNAGGAVDESKLEQTERRLDAGEEIDDILKDLYGTAIANEFGEFDYKAPLNKFKDSIENSFSNYQDSIEKYLSNQFDFKYQDDLMDIYKSDDPEANIENRARKFSTNSINNLLDDLNLPVDVSRSNYGTSFDKRINVAPNTNVTLDAYKSDDGDFTGDLNLRYSNRGKYGNIDLQSAINELGDTQDSIRYKQDIGPFSIKAGKTAGRDATGSVSYNLPSMSVGNAQTIQARVVVDSLLNAKGQLDYMYNNPNTGYFVDAGLGLNSQRSPEFNLKFGKNF